VNGTRIVIPEEIWSGLHSHLIHDGNEHVAFLLAGYASLADRSVLLARSLIRIDDSHLDWSSGHDLGLSVEVTALIDAMNQAKSRGLYLVEAHSHPLSRQPVRFSVTDLDGQLEFQQYLRDVHGEVPYGALVLGEQSVDGLLWIGGMSQPIDEVVVIGDRRLVHPTTSAGITPNRAHPDSTQVHGRQVLAFGEQGQWRLAKSHVAVIGAGGTGSIVIQQLAHLGVGSLTVIDDDVVAETNLNRLVGAKRSDIGRPKVDVAKRQTMATNRRIKTRGVRANIRDADAIAAAKEADIIFGCVDSDSGRLIMNELALAYLIPYIDVGVGIETHEGKIVEAGGRTIVWTPGRPCLLCAGEVNPRLAGEELESDEQQRFRREHGYVSGTDLPAPSVISLNGTVASIGVSELLALVTGIRPSLHYTYYDLLAQRVGPRIVRPNPKCVACGTEASGDKAGLERYSPFNVSP